MPKFTLIVPALVEISVKADSPAAAVRRFEEWRRRRGQRRLCRGVSVVTELKPSAILDADGRPVGKATKESAVAGRTQ